MTELEDVDDIDEGTIGVRPLRVLDEVVRETPKRITPSRKLVSPRMKVQREDPLAEEDWKDIQKKIDTQYERKLKEVSDDAMNKLQAFQKEHKQLLEKTQYLLDNSQIKGNEESFMTQPKQDRNRFFSPKAYDPIEKRVDTQTIR